MEDIRWLNGKTDKLKMQGRMLRKASKKINE
jgi:hypothetical protein